MEQPRPVLKRAAITVGTLIGAGLQELLQQVAIGTMDLDPVKAGGERVARPQTKGLDQRRDFLKVEGAGGLERHALTCGIGDFPGGTHGGGRNRQSTARLGRGMADPTGVPKLEKDDTALGMNGIGDAAPAGNLCGRSDAGHVRIGPAHRVDPGRLGDDQAAGGRTLAVIFGVERIGCVLRRGCPHPRQGRHDDPMRERVGPKSKRCEQHVRRHVGVPEKTTGASRASAIGCSR